MFKVNFYILSCISSITFIVVGRNWCSTLEDDSYTNTATRNWILKATTLQWKQDGVHPFFFYLYLWRLQSKHLVHKHSSVEIRNQRNSRYTTTKLVSLLNAIAKNRARRVDVLTDESKIQIYKIATTQKITLILIYLYWLPWCVVQFVLIWHLSTGSIGIFSLRYTEVPEICNFTVYLH